MDVNKSLPEYTGHDFGTVYADPPWAYTNKATRSSANGQYATLTNDELCALPVKDVVAEQAHLHLWTTNAFIFDSLRVIEAWGFEYKSMLVWVKPQMGIGNYWRVSHELLLLGVRGGLTFDVHNKKSWVETSRLKHSEKPEIFRQLIQAVSPGPRLELFGRKNVPGWTVLGNQITTGMLL